MFFFASRFLFLCYLFEMQNAVKQCRPGLRRKLCTIRMWRRIRDVRLLSTGRIPNRHDQRLARNHAWCYAWRRQALCEERRLGCIVIWPALRNNNTPCNCCGGAWKGTLIPSSLIRLGMCVLLPLVLLDCQHDRHEPVRGDIDRGIQEIGPGRLGDIWSQ